MRASTLAPRFGVYVHIPFCVTVCPYCDFNVYAGLEHTALGYVDAVVREARWWRDTKGPFPAAGSIFLGGGTPSLLDPALVASLLRDLRDVFDVDAKAEITLEANPETLDAERLRGFRDAGVTRLSLGVQSFEPAVLAMLGRAHTPGQARDAAIAAATLFPQRSVDLIFGATVESREQWTASLRTALDLPLTHVSAYGLTIEQGTAFGNAVAHGRMTPLDEDEMAARYEIACEMLGERFGHYEISNWGEPSRHNLLYWTQGDYVGLGAGAHSHLGGVRSWNHKRPAVYVDAAPQGATDGEERLTPDEQAREWLQLRLRLVEGVSLTEAAEVLGHDLPCEPLVDAGLATLDGDTLRLTRRGLLLESDVAVRLGAV